jgi:hypothetical protein
VGAPPAQQGTAVDQVQLRHHQQQPRLHRRLRPMQAAIAVAVGITVVAAGTALAAPVSQNQGTGGTGTGNPPPVAVHPVTLQPAPSGSPTPSPSAPSAPGVPTPSVQTSVSSAFAPLAGDVFVKYQDGTDASAQVSGQVTDAVSGEVAELYAQPFPFTSPPASVGSVALNPGETNQLKFRVTPTLATRYTVEVFRNSTATAPLASSAAGVIYVIMNQPGVQSTHCAGSECSVTETVTVQVPASALSTQMSEPVYTYWAINYAASGSAPTPETLQLGAGDPVVSTPRQTSAGEYQFSLTFSYSTNNENYQSEWRHCTKSMEAQDGIGLPGSGSYGCGSQTIQDSAPYLG